MTDLSRRKFVAMSAAATAGTVVASSGGLSTLTQTAAATPAGDITDVQHIVVIMQENRSFDHYFGMLKGVRGFSDRSGIQLPGGYSVFNQPNGSGRQYPWKLSGTTGSDPEKMAQCSADLPHGWSDQHAAWDSGRMDAWVSAKGSVRALGYLQRDDIPFQYALADAYTICDAYHCSGLTATGPNRTFLWSGKVDSSSYNGGDESGLTWQTYAEALQNAGVTWKVYQCQDNYGDNGLAYFTQFTNAPHSGPLWLQGMSTVPEPNGSNAEDLAAAIRGDVQNGTLPQVSWVVSNQDFSEHPNGTPQNGAFLVNQVLQALNADTNVLNSTVVFLTYDENDGFFDHVPPPVPPDGAAGEFLFSPPTPIGLGFRVPMIVISPWTRGGWVDSQVFDHTSVIQFMERWSAAIGKPATCPNISDWRRTVTGDLTSAFNFASPVYGLPALPATTKLNVTQCSGVPTPAPTTNALPVQESGTKSARALPYQPDGYVDHLEYGSNGVIKIWIKMANEGPQATKAAHFSIYANAYRGGGPWQYTVDPYNASTGTDGTQTDYFNCGSGFGNGQYDLTLIGPNRFLRQFKGNATTAGKDTEVTSYYAVQSGTGKLAIWFSMKNTSSNSATFTITSNNYRSGTWTYTVPAGGSIDDYFNNVYYCNGWYDFTVSVNIDPAWSRRFTGHMETGQASITG